ncbi:MAG: phosphoglucomutase/phosphomannomutase family protein [Candidatus Omnitrophica bacterium]|nr:phosphoglucomutase/phosphomannomutase family protein [Candidatus Omnitrophota bacterium]
MKSKTRKNAITFGTDGWRAVIGDDFTFENVRIVAQAVADYLKGKKQKRIVIGYDTRFLSREFAEEVAMVGAAAGLKTVISDRHVPTPVVSFNTRQGKYDLGIMITASHNPGKFNGIKIKTPEGGAADKQLTDKVERLLYKTPPHTIDPGGARRKKLIVDGDLVTGYKKFLRSFVNIAKIRKLKLKVLIDLMHGAGGSFVEEIVGLKNMKIDYLRKEYNPSFGGMHPEPIEENLAELMSRVKKEKYDLGFALDGDADRIALVDAQGHYIGAQIILPLLAVHCIKNRRAKAGIGKTVVGSNLIDNVALGLRAECFETPVGFKYITNLFREKLISIGGEEAGGIGFAGYIPERDGTAAFLMVLEMMASEGVSFERLCRDLQKKYGRWYYQRTSIPLRSSQVNLDKLKPPSSLLGKPVTRINRLDGIKLIASDCWLMFRASGTEPIVRVYAEAQSAKKTETLLTLGKKLINAL